MITLEDVLIMARTLYGEARGEPFQGKLAVAHVILNRVKHHHRKESTIIGVCTEPYQFSAWNENDPNREKMQAETVNDPNYRECMTAALISLRADSRDPTNGSMFYCVNGLTPEWAHEKHPIAIIGNHSFYNDVT